MGFWRHDEGDTTWGAMDADELRCWVCTRIVRNGLSMDDVIAYVNAHYKPWDVAELVRRNPERYPEKFYEELAEHIFDTELPVPKEGEDFDNQYMSFKWDDGNSEDL